MTLLVALVMAAFSLTGTVRAADSGEPIPGAAVTVLSAGRRVFTDSAGRYEIDGLLPGAYLVSVTRTGYDARAVEVIVGEDSAMRLDITLEPRPVLLGAVTIAGDTARAFVPAALPAAEATAEVGAWTVSGAQLHDDPAFGGEDVLRALATAPGVTANPESPTGLHVHGGSGDQNSILLDGVPLYNAYHAAGVLGAVDPDVVSSVTMHAGVPSARFGGAASSVIALQTQDPAQGIVTTRGGIDLLTVREMVGGPLPGDAGTFLVSGRRSTRDLFGGGVDQTNAVASFGDFFAKATVRVASGELEMFVFSSADRLAFLAEADSAEGPSSEPATDPRRNSFSWTTGTQALIWRTGGDGGARIEARAWRTRFDAAGVWDATTAPIQLNSRLTDLGAGGDVSWDLAGTLATAGVSAERFATDYGLWHTGATPADSAPPILPSLADSPVLLAAFAEDRWMLSGRWTLSAGARFQVSSGDLREFEPRVALRFAAADWLVLSGGYARMDQIVQSLRNEESLLDAVIGIGLPAASGSAGVPVVRSDQLTLTAQANLGAHTMLTLDGYARRMDGLLLIAPVTGQPFDTQQFARGSGDASGATLLLRQSGERLFGEFVYTYGVATRVAGGLDYRPSFATLNALTLAVGYRPWAATTVRGAFWMTTGRPTSLVEGDIAWTPHDLLGGTGDMSGTPQQIVGRVDAARLPSYARLDLGIRHEWHPAVLGRGAGLAAALNVTNVLDRENALGTTVSANGITRRTIPMLPRSVALGLEWAY